MHTDKKDKISSSIIGASAGIITTGAVVCGVFDAGLTFLVMTGASSVAVVAATEHLQDFKKATALRAGLVSGLVTAFTLVAALHVNDAPAAPIITHAPQSQQMPTQAKQKI